MDSSSGYSGEALELIRSARAVPGSTVRSESGIEGVLMPRYEGLQGRSDVIVLKLKSGYNASFGVSRLAGLRAIKSNHAEEARRSEQSLRTVPPPHKRGLPSVLMIATGGTIASRIEYVTGAVTPTLHAAEILKLAPALGSIANFEIANLLMTHSEDLAPADWKFIAEAVSKAHPGHDGVIVAHGTDTMQYTASYVSFALAGFPIPVAFVGSQRSSDRPSSDAPENLEAAARLVTQKGRRGVYIVMHEGASDGRVSCHWATRARKMHASARGAFRTIGAEPAATISGDSVESSARSEFFASSTYEQSITLDDRAALLKCHPGLDPAIIDGLVERGCRAIILEGTGLGHAGESVHAALGSAVESGVFVGMCTQCIGGEANMNVYESGRRLAALGVVPLRDMLAETALAKAMWALGRAGSAAGLADEMLRPVASEVSA